MNGRRPVTGVIGSVLFVLLLGAPMSPRAEEMEPRHEGKTLSEWVALMNRNPGDHQAVRRLGEMGELAIPHLIRAMRSHPDGAIRWLTHIALAQVGAVALPELDRVMIDGDAGARIQAVLAFEKILKRDAIPRLRAATQDPNTGVRVRAFGALLRLGEPRDDVLSPMLEILRKGEQGNRWLAAEALGQSGAAAAGAEDTLAEALQDSSPSVAERALHALEEIGTPEAMRHVWRAYTHRLLSPQTDRKDKVKTAYQLGIAGASAELALATLYQVAEATEEDILVRGYAAWAAERIRPRPANEPGRTFHVSQQNPQASDENPGTAERPWRAIQRAAETLRPGDTLLIYAGTYREFVRPFLGGTGPDRMITYRAAPGETPVIVGSDVWNAEWRDEGNGLWSTAYERHPWDDPESWPKPQLGPMHRAEQVFMDGTLLVHVGTSDELEQREGAFFTDDEAGRLWVHLAEGVSPADRLIERSMRQQVFAPAVRGLGYIRVQGLTLRHAAAPESNGSNWFVIGHRAVMSVRSGHHWIIEDCTIEWGNAQGLDVGTEGWGSDLSWQPIVSEEKGFHQVRRNRVNYHGVAGIVGWGNGQRHLLLEDNVTNYNCRKGNLYQYEAAGVKIHRAQDSIIRRHRSHRNDAFGIWLDHDCLRNRVTQCILTENMGAGLFFEVSPGPLLADNNVIIGTRDAPRGSWGEGIYSHDGNRATYINNFVRDCVGYGVRVRNLFGRRVGDVPTTTSHNRIYNNFLFGNARGFVSLNPEVSRAEDNRSDHNILWHDGSGLTARLENRDAGVLWEDTSIGRAMGCSGVGDLEIPFSLWVEPLGQDENSLPVPSGLLFVDRSPEKILDALTRLWPDTAPGLNEGCGEVVAQVAANLLGRIRSEFRDARLARAVSLGPFSGIQIWSRPDGPLGIQWERESGTIIDPLDEHVLLEEPIPGIEEPALLVAGEAAMLALPENGRVAFTGLPAQTELDRLVVSSSSEASPGGYAVVVVGDEGWRVIPIELVEAYKISGFSAIRDAAGTGVIVSIDNARNATAPADLTLTFDDSTLTRRAVLDPATTTTVRIPVDSVGAVATDLRVVLPGVTFTEEAVFSFAYASRSEEWRDVPSYPVEDFPGGAFPEGAEAFALFQGGLSALWSARCDARALHVWVQVQDDTHLQTKAIDRLWEQDSVQLRILAEPSGRPVELAAGLSSSSGAALVHRNLSPDEERFPAGEAADVDAKIVRDDPYTSYQVTIPWEMMGLSAAPPSGSGLKFSLLVNDDDGRGRHGIQWFFGIHSHRGEEERMGVLWMD